MSSSNISRFPPTPQRLNSSAAFRYSGTVHLRGTLLGRDAGHIRCPRVHRLGLSFGGLDPLKVMEKLLHGAGLPNPELLRQAFVVPPGRLIAMPLPESEERLDAQSAPEGEILEQALMLGLCTQYVYDPGRPVLWTRTSLQRGLELFDPTGFYA